MISWKVIGLIYAMCIFWLGYEVYRAPMVDETEKIIKNKKNK